MTRLAETEHQAQCTLFAWADLMKSRYPELGLMYANPNGGYRPKKTGADLKKSGTKSGIPDVTLPVPRRGFHGMYLELKVGRNRPSETQEAWFDALTRQGYRVEVAWGSEAAIQAVCDYLGIDAGIV